jgi:hypothetical protein
MLRWLVRGLLFLFAAAIGYLAVGAGWMAFLMAREGNRLGNLAPTDAYILHEWYVETPWGTVYLSPWQLGVVCIVALAAAVSIGWFACSSRFWSESTASR